MHLKVSGLNHGGSGRTRGVVVELMMVEMVMAEEVAAGHAVSQHELSGRGGGE